MSKVSEAMRHCHEWDLHPGHWFMSRLQLTPVFQEQMLIPEK